MSDGRCDFGLLIFGVCIFLLLLPQSLYFFSHFKFFSLLVFELFVQDTKLREEISSFIGMVAERITAKGFVT